MKPLQAMETSQIFREIERLKQNTCALKFYNKYCIGYYILPDPVSVPGGRGRGGRAPESRGTTYNIM